MKNRNMIGIKLITGFVVVAVLSAIIGAVGFQSVTTMNKLLRDMYLDKFLSAVDLENAALQATSYNKSLYQHIGQKDPDAMRRIRAGMELNEKRMLRYLAGYKRTSLIEREKEIMKSFDGLWGRYDAACKKVLDSSGRNRDEEAARLLNHEVEPLFQLITGLLAEDVEINIRQGREAFEKNGDIYYHILIFMVGRLVVTFVLTIGMGVYITRSITAPLLKVVGQANSIAKGDIHLEKLAVKKNDEIGELAAAFSSMIESFSVKENIITAIGNKDLSIRVGLASDRDSIGLSLEKMLVSLNEVFRKVDVVLDHMDDGLLRMRKLAAGKKVDKKNEMRSIRVIESHMAQLRTMIEAFSLRNG